MTVEMQRVSGEVHVTLEGRLDGDAISGLCRALSDGLCMADDRVVLDLRAVDFLSSAPVRLFCSLARVLSLRGVSLTVSGCQAPVASVLSDAGLDSLLSPACPPFQGAI